MAAQSHLLSVSHHLKTACTIIGLFAQFELIDPLKSNHAQPANDRPSKPDEFMTEGYLFCVYDRKENFHSCYVVYEADEEHAKTLVSQNLESKNVPFTDVRKIKELNGEKLEVFIHMNQLINGIEFRRGDCVRVGIYV